MEWYKHWLGRAHRQYRFDVLHCHSIYPCGYLAALCQGSLGIPTVITSHGGDVHLTGHRLSKPGMPARYARSIAAADALISISRFTYDGFLQLCPTAQNIVSIPNGVHLEPFQHQVTRPEQLDRKVQRANTSCSSAGCTSAKEWTSCSMHWPSFPARRRGLLVVAGDGDERASLEAQCVQLKLTKPCPLRRLGQGSDENLAPAKRAVRRHAVAHLGSLRPGGVGKLCRGSGGDYVHAAWHDGPGRPGRDGTLGAA